MAKKEFTPMQSIGTAATQITEFVSDVTLLYSYVGTLLSIGLIDERVKDTLQENYNRVKKHYTHD